MNTLVLHHEDGGLRHYLDGRDVHAGDMLELQRADGSWVRGRYEWSFEETARPAFYMAGKGYCGYLDGPGGKPTTRETEWWTEPDQKVVFLSAADLLRWPA